MNQEQKQVVKAETGLEVVSLFEQHSMAAAKIAEIALSNTRPEDWVNFGGHAWLDAPGAERIGRALGLTVKDWKWEKKDFKDDEGPHYYVISTGKVGHTPTDLWTDAIGVAWSRKPFWYLDKGQKRHVGEINLGNIIKDSYSDMERNGITRLLGLRGFTWEYLKQYGVTKEKAAEVSFRTGAKGGKTTKNSPQGATSAKASTQQTDYLIKMALKKVIESKDADIAGSLPKDINTNQVNTLLKLVMEEPEAMTLAEWKSKVKEVTG